MFLSIYVFLKEEKKANFELNQAVQNVMSKCKQTWYFRQFSNTKGSLYKGTKANRTELPCKIGNISLGGGRERFKTKAQLDNPE